MASNGIDYASPVTDSKSAGAYGLKFRCLSPLEVLAQSVANIAPTACTAAFIPVAFASAGNGTWLTFVVATIGLVLVALNINQFSRSSASPGSLYSYISMGLGPTAGVISGWGLLAAYLGTAVALTGAVTKISLGLMSSLPASLIGSPPSQYWVYLLATVTVLLPWLVAFRDIRLSAKLMLAMELASVMLIVVLAIGVFGKLGFHVHADQIKLKDVTAGHFCIGLVTAIFCYVGFESATALGEEAKNPLRTIPRAVVMSSLIVGCFYTMMSFAEVGAFAGDATTTLDACPAPFTFMAHRIGMDFLAPLLGIGALISGLGCVLACLNAGSRVLFSMGRHGIFHNSVGGAHKTNETPHVAVTLATVVVLIATYLMFWGGFNSDDVLNLASTFATFGFLLVYILISIAAPIYRKRQGRTSTASILISVLGVLFMMIPVVGSFYPVPPKPVCYLPYIFAVYLLLGAIWMIVQRNSSSGVVQNIERDLEQIGARFGEAKGVVAEAQGQSMADAELLP